MRSERARGCVDQVAGRVTASGVSTWPEAPRPGARPLGKERRRVGDRLDAAPCSAWSSRIVIAKLVDATRGQVNEVSVVEFYPALRVNGRG
jgi:hypothetical protein